MNNNEKIIENIKNVIDELRPFVLADGGDIEFVEYKDGIVYISFQGSCADCPMKQMTLDSGIKETLMNEVPEVIDVRLV